MQHFVMSLSEGRNLVLCFCISCIFFPSPMCTLHWQIVAHEKYKISIDYEAYKKN